MACGSVVESVITASISDSFILCGIGRVWGGTWAVIGFCLQGVYYGIIFCNLFDNLF